MHPYQKKASSSSRWFRSTDLWVMGPARFRCAIELHHNVGYIVYISYKGHYYPPFFFSCSSKFYISQSMMNLFLTFLLLIAGSFAQNVFRVNPSKNKLRFVHVSDVHFHVPLPTDWEERMLANLFNVCIDVEEDDYRCGPVNSTNFLKSVYTVEKPDLVVFTGDIIDSASLFPRLSMDLVYSTAHPIPWAASLGNHDEETRLLTREQVAEHILHSKGTLSLSAPESPAPLSFYIDVLGPTNVTVARLVFFDSRIDHVSQMISDAQLDWFENLPATSAPVLAFFHIPIRQYQDAVDAGIPLVGNQREPICNNKPNPNIFPTLKKNGVVATFCGHDHTNDFCVPWQGITLCYEGSPGFTAYGKCNEDKTECVARRVRVTELTVGEESLDSVRTWLRVDAGGSVASPERLHNHIIFEKALGTHPF